MSTLTPPFIRHRAACVLLLALSAATPSIASAQEAGATRRRDDESEESSEEARRRERHERRAARRAERERLRLEAEQAAQSEKDEQAAKVSAPDALAPEPSAASHDEPETAPDAPVPVEPAIAQAETLTPEERDERRRGDRLDPTTPIDDPPLLSVPMPGADKETKAQQEEAAAETSSVPGDPWGDVGTGGLLSLRAFFQFRYQTTYSERSESPRDSYVVRERWLAHQGDGYSFNRLFVRLASNPSPYISFKAVFDFAQLLAGDPEDVVKQTYITLSPIPEHLELVAGMFKIPVSITELDSSNRWEFADFGQLNGLMGDLGFISRDLGLMLLANPLKKAKRVRLSAGIFRGDTKDEHDSGVGIVSGRAEVNPNKHFRFGADVAYKPRTYTFNRPFETSSKEELPDPIDPLYPAARRYGKGKVITADARYKRKGFMLRGEGVYGDRTDLDLSYGAKTFWGAWGIVAQRIDFGSFQLLPAFRAEWMDANREAKVGVQRTLSGALTVLFLERLRFLVDVTHTEVQRGTPIPKQPEPILREPYMALDNFRVTAQLQLEL